MCLGGCLSGTATISRMDTMMIGRSESAEETKQWGRALGACLRAGDVVLLSGDLGAGKTQFAQGVASALGIPEDEVTSPTFNILLSYEGTAPDGTPFALNHFDLYRLERPEQLVDIDFAGVLEGGGASLIEWADKFPAQMPEYRLQVTITIDAHGGRTLSVQAEGARARHALDAWKEAHAAFEDAACENVVPASAKPSRACGVNGAATSAAPLAAGASAAIPASAASDVSTVQEVPSTSAAPQAPAASDAGLAQKAPDGFQATVAFSMAATQEAPDMPAPQDGSIVLAFDTSNEYIAIGLGRLVAEERRVEFLAGHELPAHRASNVGLLPAIDDLMRDAGLSRAQIACVACGRGPGSFTGVRICMATAKGLAMALEVPLWGVSTPDALAWELWACGTRGSVALIADAMRKEVYPVRYAISDNGIARGNVDVVMKAAEGVRYAEGAALVAGDGLVKYADMYRLCAPLAPEEQWHPTGRGLLLAFQDAWRSGAIAPFDMQAGDPACALPVYTRLSDAEENERVRLADETPRDLKTGVQHVGASVAKGNRVAFRPLDARHAGDVARLESRLMGSDAWNEAMVRDELPRADRVWWAAYDGADALIAYAGALVIDGDMQILKIATVPERQRQGIARDLLAHLAEDARALGADKASLEVRVSNEKAIAFYKRLGFASAGRRPHYYSDREDAFILCGPLPVFQREHAVGGMEISHIEVANAPGVSIGNASASGLADGNGSASGVPDKGSFKGSPAVGDAKAAKAVASPLILAIESSCDETAAAIIDGDGGLHSDVVASQIDFHARFGGVVPEIASRKHIEAICGVVQEGLDVAARSMARARLRLRELDAIAVTYAPGLVGALVVGVAFAKGAAWGANLPFIRVNHLEGHLYANKIAVPDIKPPMVVSLVSGGHTMLVHVRDWGDYVTLGSTIDDAVGEAFDKVAKALGLGYPGGPVISKLAAKGNPKAVRFPRAMMHSGDLRFSLSGLKTAVISYIQKEEQAGRALNLPDIAASFQQAVIDVQVAKARTALEETGAREFCLGGGVAANPALRQAYQDLCRKMNVRLTMPPLSSCTDNAGMIAFVALDRYHQGKYAGLDADVSAHASLDAPY